MSRVFLAAVVTALAFAGNADAQNLDPIARRIAQAWQRGDASTIGNLAAKAGLSVDIGGQKVGPLQSRQAAMRLKREFEQRETVSARLGIVQQVDGDPKSAFVEITWVTKARGTTIPEESVVFFGLVVDGDGWRINEIRLIQ